VNQPRRYRILGVLLMLPAISLLFWITAMLASSMPGTVAFAVNVHGLNMTTDGAPSNLRPAPLSLSVLEDARLDAPSPTPAPTARPSSTPHPSPAATPAPAASPTAPTLGPTPPLIPVATPTLPVTLPTPTPGPATISGQVLDSQTKNAIVAATVSLSPGGAMAVTDANGNFSFSVSAGTYTLTASALTYTSASQSVTVKGGQRLVVSFKLTSVTAYGSISGGVVDSATQAPIVGATVSLSNGLMRVTDANGNFSFTVVLSGSYTLTVSGLGYVTQSQSVTVKAGHTTNVQVGLVHG